MKKIGKKPAAKLVFLDRPSSVSSTTLAVAMGLSARVVELSRQLGTDPVVTVECGNEKIRFRMERSD